MEDGLILGFMTYLSFIFSFKHFPLKLKTFFLTNFFITDIFCVAVTFLLLTNISKSIVSVIASMVVGTLVNLTLMAYQAIYPQQLKLLKEKKDN